MAGNSCLGCLFFGYALGYFNVSLKTINKVFNIAEKDEAVIDGLMTGSNIFFIFSSTSNRSSVWSVLSWTYAKCFKQIKNDDSHRYHRNNWYFNGRSS